MILTLVILPVVLFLLGVPVFTVLLASGIATLLLHMSVPMAAVHQVMFGGVDKFALLAVPYFILAGELMARSGMSGRLIGSIAKATGRVRAAIPLTTIGSSTLLGAISGSSPATVAATAKVLYPALIDSGAEKRFSLGLITSSGAISIVIPPSIAMILYGASAEQSIPKLFTAGLVPGAFIALAMALYVLWHCRISTPVSDARPSIEKDADIVGFLTALALPVIVLSGIYSGLFSPTEAGGIACVYTILLARFVYRSMSWKDILDCAGDAALLSAQVMIVVAAAALFSWVLTVQQVPQGLLGYIQSVDLSPLAFLLVINIVLLLLGCFIDPTSAILVLTPILLPIILSLGIDPIHFGIVMTVNLSIGMFTPPFGLNIFVTQSVLQADIRDIYRGLGGFFCVQTTALLCITYIPEMSLALTRFVN
ncbi:MAG: TRAP transporter large permease [Alphaproteobacteria bacterium]